MKQRSFFRGSSCMIVLLICSCEYESPSVLRSRSLPVKEIHYNFETSEIIGEKTLTYNADGYLIHEYFKNLQFPPGDKEILYEYDRDFNLIIKMLRDPNVSDVYYTQIFEFENGQKKTERSLYDGQPSGYKTLYSYTGKLLDSAQRYFYSTIEKDYLYLTTTFYRNDALGRVIEALGKDGMVETAYKYVGNNLVESCDPVPGTDGLETCIRNEYNSRGELLKTYDTSPWWDKIQEERFYKDGLLYEKKVYTYPGYEPGNTVDILLIRYEY